MKKRIMSLLMVTALMLSLTACGSNQQTVSENNNKIEEKNPTIGEYRTESYVYTNEFLEVRCQLDDEWEVYDSIQIAELANQEPEYTNDEELIELLNEKGMADLFYTQSESGHMDMGISVADTEIVYGELMDEEQFAERAMEGIDPTLGNLGTSESHADIISIEFAGKTHKAIMIQSDGYYHVMVLTKLGKYMAIYTAISQDTDRTEDILGMFSSL